MFKLNSVEKFTFEQLKSITMKKLLTSAFVAFAFVCFGQVPANLDGMAVMTHFSNFSYIKPIQDGPVLRLIDVRQVQNYGVHNNVPRINNMQWRASRMGQVFGLAVDTFGNIYATATTSYAGDYRNDPLAFGSAGPGGVYKINPSTGNVTDLVTTVPHTTTSVLGTNKLPNGNGAIGPGLGNICYDEVHHKLFVSNFEDGKIYRINPNSGQVEDIYDPVVPANYGGTLNPPMIPDNGVQGFAPIGDRVWGVAYNPKDHRIYYGVWAKYERPDLSNNIYNVVRSVGFDASGNLDGTTDALEILIPNDHLNDHDTIGTGGIVSDLAFAIKKFPEEDAMAIATHGMYDDFTKYTGNSSAYQYFGNHTNGWRRKNVTIYPRDSRLNIGFAENTKASGGVDYGYSGYVNGVNTGLNKRIWHTGLSLVRYIGNYFVDGLQSTPDSGNTVYNYDQVGYFIDWDNSATPHDHFTQGDVELYRSCCEPCYDVKNHIENSGLEQGSLPEMRGQFENRVNNWFVATGDPEIFDEDFTACLPDPVPGNLPCGISPADVNCVGIPCNHFGYEEHRSVSGKRYAGLYAAVGVNPYNPAIPLSSVPNASMMHEAIETKLNQALTPGKTYTLILHASKAENAEQAVGDQLVSDPGFTVKMSTKAEYHPPILSLALANEVNYFSVPGDVIYQSSVKKENGWEQFIINFTPNKAYNHIIVESRLTNTSLNVAISNDPPRDPADLADDNVDSIANYLVVNDAHLGIHSYLYVDDITLAESCYTDSIVIADAGPDLGNCNGSGVFIGGSPTASGGTAPYTYQWTKLSPSGGSLYLNNSQSANPLAFPPVTTTYRVTVTDANGFTDSDNVTVYGPQGFYADAGNDKGLCDSTCVIIGGNPTAVGGSGSYSYNWSPSSGYMSNSGVSNPKVCVPTNSTTTFTVTVRDDVSRCFASDQVTVTQYGGSALNLVNNGDFDLGATPAQRGELDLATPWFAATGSPDLFDEDVNCAPLCNFNNNVDVPINHFGNRVHRLNTSEKRYVGIWSLSSQFIEAFTDVQIELLKRAIQTACDALPMLNPCPLYDVYDIITDNNPQVEFYTEGIETRLSATLLAGNDYKVSFYAAYANSGEFTNPYFSGNGVNSYANGVDVKVKFSETEATNVGHKPVVADLLHSQLIMPTPNPNWVHVEFTFTPQKDYEYLIIEAGKPFQGDEAYLYIDDVSIRALCDQPGSSKSEALIEDIEESNEEPAIRIYPNPTREQLNVDLGVNAEGTVHVYLMDVSGKLVHTEVKDAAQRMKINTSSMEFGTYLLLIDYNGKRTVERVVISE